MDLLKIEELKNILLNYHNIVFFGGAGVSTESNIPDFRGIDGIMHEKMFHYPVEMILSHSFFYRNPQLFYQFYFQKMIYLNALPNDAHHALQYLESQRKLTAIVTQNIDGLHQMSGSEKVYELHGNIHKNTCIGCGLSYSLQEIMNEKNEIPICKSCGNIIKPNVVLYEEPLDEKTMEQAIKAISTAEVLIVGGTSLKVYPAASFLSYFHGKKKILINFEKTPYDKYADLVINEKIGKVLKEVVRLLKEEI